MYAGWRQRGSLHHRRSIEDRQAESHSTFPDGIAIKQVQYDRPDTLIDALRGQDALIIILSGRAPIQEIEAKLVEAAAEAGVPWILPNELVKDFFIFQPKGTEHTI